jgi:hypothetical protein
LKQSKGKSKGLHLVTEGERLLLVTYGEAKVAEATATFKKVLVEQQSTFSSRLVALRIKVTTRASKVAISK